MNNNSMTCMKQIFRVVCLGTVCFLLGIFNVAVGAEAAPDRSDGSVVESSSSVTGAKVSKPISSEEEIHDEMKNRGLTEENLKKAREEISKRRKSTPAGSGGDEPSKAVVNTVLEVERKYAAGKLDETDSNLKAIENYVLSSDEQYSSRLGVVLGMKINEYTFPIYMNFISKMEDANQLSKVLSYLPRKLGAVTPAQQDRLCSFIVEKIMSAEMSENSLMGLMGVLFFVNKSKAEEEIAKIFASQGQMISSRKKALERYLERNHKDIFLKMKNGLH